MRARGDRNGGWRQYRLLAWSAPAGGVRRGPTITALAARCAWLALLRALASFPAAAAPPATPATFTVFGFLGCARLRLGDGCHLVDRCARFLRRSRLAWRTLFLRVARPLTAVIASVVALPIPRLTLPAWRLTTLRRPWLRPVALIPLAVTSLARLVATLLALVSAAVAVLTSAPAHIARRFGPNGCRLHGRRR
jgi:hypothetical protein